MTVYTWNILGLTLMACMSPVACSKCIECTLLSPYDSVWWQWLSIGAERRESRVVHRHRVARRINPEIVDGVTSNL